MPWKISGSLETGVGEGRGSTSSFIFRSWQRKLRLIPMIGISPMCVR